MSFLSPTTHFPDARLLKKILSLSIFPVAFSPTILLADHDDLHFWDSPIGGDFAVSTNWDPVGVPGTNDGAVFNLANTYTVDFAGDVTNESLLVEMER